IIDDSFTDDRDAGILYLGSGKMLVTNFRHDVETYEKYYKDWIAEDAGDAGLAMLNLCGTLPQEHRKGGSFYKVSCDYGETWGEKKQIPVSCPHGPIQLKDGSIFYIGKEMYSYGAEEPDTINAYISDAETIDFKKVGRCEKPALYGWEKFHEPHCTQLEDGRILALFRAHIDKNGENFTMYKTFSSDKGKTWSVPEATGICGSPPHLLKLKSGKILLSYARRMEPFGIYARVIEKDGTFGEEELLIDKATDSDIGYPATVELDDGSFVTVFYKREISEKYTSIVSVNWNL
ncbi:MAG: glycoside hydrolase, partial [Clostridia bacterium]|nr:glycoside hydrolase [Clostridia bacterium]